MLETSLFPPQKIFTLLDLTSLNETDQPETIKILCGQATWREVHAAAVCIYPRFVALAKDLLCDSGIKIAAVTNFPEGNQPCEEVVEEISQAIANGADEIDMVMPYQDLLAGKTAEVATFLLRCKAVCGEKIKLKVILETGALQHPHLIAQASEIAIDNGADFLKTSTGKISIGATLKAAEIMLTIIHGSHQKIGFKAAGGIRTIAQASQYLALTEKICGAEWLSPELLRLGASSLAQALREKS